MGFIEGSNGRPAAGGYLQSFDDEAYFGGYEAGDQARAAAEREKDRIVPPSMARPPLPPA
jgi:hypothetical protein